MFSLLFLIIVLSLIVLTFWFPTITSFTVFLIYLILEVLFFVSSSVKIKPKEELGLNQEEEIIFSRYSIFFNYTFSSVDFSRVFSTIQMSSLILTPLFLFKGLFIFGLMFGVNYLLVGSLAVKLNPAFFISERLRKGDNKYLHEFEIIQSVHEKIEIFRDKQRVV